jgi:hypothetical protein
MTVTRLSNSITFKVHDVEPVTNAKETWKAYEGINALLEQSEEKGFQPILSCSGYNSNTVRQITHHAVIEAVHTAFAEHRPLVLSPDMLWITIMQGVAQHVRNNPEKLRSALVSHQGKLEVAIAVLGFNADSPESDWQAVIDNMGEALQQNIGPAYDRLMCNFTTTGPLERTVCAISILDMYQPYFEYVMYCICGIPAITLEGAPADWRALREKIELLEPFDMEWWVSSLRPMLDQFVRAADGDIDSEYWQNIYKLKDAYGWQRINGWAARLIPYIRDGVSGAYTVVNPLLEQPFAIQPNEEDAVPQHPIFGMEVTGITSASLPSGLSVVPLKIKSETETREMQLIGGFVGIEQVEVGEGTGSHALRPKLGWAVRKVGGIDGLFANLPEGCKIVPPLSAEEYREAFTRLEESTGFGGVSIPGALNTFYRHCNGIELSAPGAGKFRGFEKLERVTQPDQDDEINAEVDRLLKMMQREEMTESELQETRVMAEGMATGNYRAKWLAFYDLPDGSVLAVDLEAGRAGDGTASVRRIDFAKGESEVVYESVEEGLVELAMVG